MVQVYFDKELVSRVIFFFFLCTSNNNILFSTQASHIDKTDFLNVVVREKKRFENTLDDSVAAGLNAGTEALVNQVRFYTLINLWSVVLNPYDFFRLTILFQNSQTRESIIHLRMIPSSLAQRRVV